ncbi:hypothetical protein [Phycicoccus sonneratiae]|nr:hypothetical protein [Phycicoccus sonneraticus]
MPSPSRTPGRRRAPGRVRRLPDGFPGLGASWAVKSAAGLCVVGGAAVALTVPAEQADAEADTSPAASVATAALVQRSGFEAASRSRADRDDPAPAVAAPTGSRPVQPAPVGVAGVKAVAKPKPTETAASSGGSSSAAAPTGSWSGKTTARCTNIGLIPNAVGICSAVDSLFGPPTIGGRRATADEHGTGQAIDFMISGASQGDAIAAWVQQNVGKFNVKYLIWQQRYWAPGEGWSTMEDRGSPTANHYDHVHVTVNY